MLTNSPKPRINFYVASCKKCGMRFSYTVDSQGDEHLTESTLKKWKRAGYEVEHMSAESFQQLDLRACICKLERHQI